MTPSPDPSPALFLIGVAFGVLAAVSAFLITYQEYVRHLPARAALRAGLQAGLFAFVFFTGLSAVLTWTLPRILSR
jgi:uncharacterized membrane protein